ncbi:MAG: PAS domain-containing protein, partial [Cyclobacteriaceae bacterium]
FGAVIAATYFYLQYRKLQAKDADLSQAFEISREGVYYMNLDTQKTRVSDGYLRLMGYDPQSFDFDPDKWIDFVHPDDREWVRQSYEKIESKPDTYISIRYRLLTQDRSYIWVLDRSKVVGYDKDGIAERSIGTITQIDQLKEIEDALAVKNEELKDALEQLRNSQARLVEMEKMAALGMMTSGITFELNNPLNYVKGNVHPLRRDFQELKSFIETILQDEQVASSAIVREQTDLLNFDLLFTEIVTLLDGIKSGAGKSVEILESLQMFSFDKNSEKPMLLNLNEIISTAIRLISSRIHSNITLHKSYGEVQPILGWPGRLNQLFFCLLCNSIDAIGTRIDGNIFISTQQREREVVTRIEDDGEGIGNEIRDRIFDPFFTTRTHSSGLGLPIVKTIAESHDGYVRLLEDQSRTVFEVVIPITGGDV